MIRWGEIMLSQQLPEKQTSDSILGALVLGLLVMAAVTFIIYVGAVIGSIITSGVAWIPVLIFRLSVLIGIVSGLLISYTYIFARVANKSRVRQIYALLTLFIVSVSLSLWYNIHHETLLIKDLCTQFDQAIEQGEYETAYELMSPSYRQRYSLTRFINGDGREFRSCVIGDKSYIVEVAIEREVAHVIPYPLGSLMHEIFLKKINHKWYFTGEVRLSQA